MSPIRSSLALSAAALLFLAACDNKQQGGPPAMPPAEVSVVTIQPQPVQLFTELPGRTSPFRVAEVRPQVGGILVKRLFEEGSEVKAGQQLYQIDPATYQAAVQSAEADLAKARATLKTAEAKAARYSDLVQINAVSRQDYDDVVATLEQDKAQIMVAQAEVDTAKINLGYTKVYAPISGRIAKSAVTEGALVTAGQTTALTTITQLDPIYVDLNQSSSDLLRLRQEFASGKLSQGDAGKAPVSLTLDGSSHAYDKPGELKFADVTVDSSTGAVQVRAMFPNPDKLLYPGLFVRARIAEGERAEGILVPQQAIVRNADGSAMVWVVGEGDKAEARPVVTNQAQGDKWLIDSGLKAGERVITEGLQKVRPGAAVKPVPAQS